MTDSPYNPGLYDSRPKFSFGISEIVLVVDDVLRSADFYRDVVGLVPMHEPSDAWAWFWAGAPGVPQHLALRKGSLLFEEHSPHPAGHRWGHIHYALEIAESKADEAMEHVRAKDVAVYGPVDLAWMKARSFYFYDPDGNLIEFWFRS